MRLRSILTRANFYIPALLAIGVVSGCATIFTGTSDTVAFHSEPSGAKVYLNGNYMGNTPTSLSLKRDRDYNVMVKKDGYEPGSAMVGRSFNAVSLLNLTSILCWLVDLVTGAVWKFDRDVVTVSLDPVGKTSALDYSKNRVVAGAGMTVAPYQGKIGVFLGAQTATQ